MATPHATPVTPPTESERTWAMFAHLSGPIAALLSLGTLPFVGPLVIWLAKRHESAFVAGQAKEALNFHITVVLTAIAIVVGGVVFGILTLGFGLVPAALAYLALSVIAFVLGIVAGVRVQQGVAYRYPFAIRFVP